MENDYKRFKKQPKRKAQMTIKRFKTIKKKCKTRKRRKTSTK